MTESLDISVVISTYNRCDMLLPALESVLAQKTNNVRYEVIVVDNNSKDKTRDVVEAFITRGHGNLHYILESRQGVSYARNTGIERSRAPLIAFFDDDECVAPDWVANIKRAFDEHPEIDFLGGRVLPRWEAEPPTWLASNAHWAPVALTDYGDASFYSNVENPVCLISANLAVRRAVFDRIGLFDPNLQRVKGGIGSTEDHELLLRLWRSGGQGMYVPNVVVEADVPVTRMTRAYHRRWHTGHGKYSALMRLSESVDADGRLLLAPRKTTKFFGAPAYIYRDLMATSISWLKAALRRDNGQAFEHENRARHLISYIRASHQNNLDKQSFVAELGAFVKFLLRRKSVAAPSETKRIL